MAVVRLKTQQGGIELVLRILGCDDVDEKPLQLFDAEVLEADASSEEFGTKSITPEEMAQMEAKLGSILQALVKAVAKQKPDKLEPFATHWLSVNYKNTISGGKCALTSHDKWSARPDVFRSEQELTAYLQEIRLPMLLEVAVSAAVLIQPNSMADYLMDFFLEAEQEAIRFEAQMRERAENLASQSASESRAEKEPKKVGAESLPKQGSEGTQLKIHYEVGEDGKLKVDVSILGGIT